MIVEIEVIFSFVFISNLKHFLSNYSSLHVEKVNIEKMVSLNDHVGDEEIHEKARI